MTTNVFNFFWNIQGIGAFFRDLSTHTLKEEVVEQLQENICWGRKRLRRS